MKYDIAIIGASLSGSTAAFVLSNLGFSVALIDKDAFPRRKACGEGLSAGGRRAIEHIGLVDLSELTHAELKSFEINIGKEVKIPISQPITGITRLALDEAIFKRAKVSPCVDTFIGESVRSIKRTNEEFEVITDSNSVCSQAVLVGSGSIIPKISGIGFKESFKRRNRYGLSFHVRRASEEVEASSVRIYPTKTSETYITPVGENVFNISYLGTKEDIKKLFRDRKLSSFLDSKGYSEPLDSPLGKGPFFFAKRVSNTERFRFIGDSLTTLDPIGGMGMTHAVLSAISNGESLAKELKGVASSGVMPLGSLEKFTNFSSKGISFLSSNRGIIEKLPSAPLVLTGAFFMNSLVRKIVSLSEQILTL